MFKNIVLAFATYCVTGLYVSAQNSIMQYQYWFNTDFDNAVNVLQDTTKNVTLSPQLDASSLSDGLHVLNMRFQDKNGVWSSVKSQFFLKTSSKPVKENAPVCQYWIDKDFANAITTETDKAKDIILNQQLNLETLNEGLHVLNMRFQDKNGVWSPVKSQFFIKSAKNNQAEDGQIVSYQYWLDDNFTESAIVTLENVEHNVDISQQLDFTRIPKGVHYLNFRTKDNRGKWSSVVTDTVEKISLPIADFSFDTLEVTCKSITLQFNDNSIDGDAYQWNFGDESDADTNKNPIHTFSPGEFSISLTIRDTILNSTNTKVLPFAFEEEKMYKEIFETACESFVWNDTEYTNSGDYTQTLQTVHGCDSVVTLHLTINNSVEDEIEETACESFVWNDTEYTVSGDYIQTFQTVYGCDSVVTLHLTINNSVENEIEETACESFVWNDTEYTISGDYTQKLQTVHGCDSVVTLHLTINHASASVFTQTTTQPFEWNGVTYTESGEYIQTFESISGCDSVVTLHLTIQTAIDNVNLSQVAMYPIPVTDYLNIESPEEINSIEIFNTKGQLIISTIATGTAMKCDVSSLYSGIYWIKIYCDKQIVPIQRTFVKE